ncbi:hypothetical protein [Sulfurimonas sp.]
MYVSSYSTYIQTNASDKTTKQRVEKPSSEFKTFESKTNKNDTVVSYKNPNLPVDYISKSQVLNNKQEVEYQKQQLQEPNQNSANTTKEKINQFSGHNSLINAKSAYESNSKMFSLFAKPHVALDQTPTIDKKLPKKAQDAKELSMKNLMVNTYIANDNYYQVTA